MPRVQAMVRLFALVSGLIVYLVGRRSRDRRAMRMGMRMVALLWFGFVLVIESVHQAVG